VPFHNHLDPPVASLHIGRVLYLPPLAALGAADGHCARLIRAHDAKHACWAVGSTGWSLSVLGDGSVCRNSPYDAYRRWFGRLRSRRLELPTGVELELSPWSSTRCEIGLRPASKLIGVLPGLGQRRWFNIGVEVVELLRDEWERICFDSILDALGRTEDTSRSAGPLSVSDQV
jgi:hypothetical protein